MDEFRQNTRRLMWRYNAVYATPFPRYTFGSWYTWRRHEHYFNSPQKWPVLRNRGCTA